LITIPFLKFFESAENFFTKKFFAKKFFAKALLLSQRFSDSYRKLIGA